MKINTYVEREKVEKAFIKILAAISIVLSLVDIFIHMKWWGGIGLFFSTMGAFALFGVISLILFLIFGFLIDSIQRSDSDIGIFAFLGVFLVALLSVPIKYLHFYSLSLPGFWLICTPIVCIVSSLFIIIPFFVIYQVAFDKDRLADELKFKKWINDWDCFIMEPDVIEKFEKEVECRRRELNLRYAKYNCMRQVLPARIVVEIANKYIEELQHFLKSQRELPCFFEDSMNEGYFDELDNTKWCFDVEHPMASFAGFVTEFKFNGRHAYVAIKMSVIGECLLVIDGKGVKYSENEFKSFDEMLKFLDKKIGIES